MPHSDLISDVWHFEFASFEFAFNFLVFCHFISPHNFYCAFVYTYVCVQSDIPNWLNSVDFRSNAIVVHYEKNRISYCYSLQYNCRFRIENIPFVAVSVHKELAPLYCCVMLVYIKHFLSSVLFRWANEGSERERGRGRGSGIGKWNDAERTRTKATSYTTIVFVQIADFK